MTINNLNQWDIWFAEFPFEDTSELKDRPVIILSIEPLKVLSIKVTSSGPRTEDKFDIPITKWQDAGLKNASTARIAKTIRLDVDKFRRKLGTLHMDDREKILNTFSLYISQSKAE